MWSDWKDKVKPNAQIPKKLLWDVDWNNFDIHKGRALVATRVAERGTLDDFNTMFSLYGGVKGVRKIYQNEVKELNPRALAFVSVAFGLKKDKIKCYTQKRSKQVLWNS